MQRAQVRSAKSGDFHVAVRAAEDPAELGEADLVLFCVKSYDTVGRRPERCDQ